MSFKGGHLSELTQWSDLIATLHMLGHVIVIAVSHDELIQATSEGFHYDLLFTDYLGMYGIHDAGLVGVYKCRLRILDSFGTEPQFSFRTMEYQADPQGEMFSSWGLESLRQIWTLYPHTPDNSFLGFVMEQPSNSPSHTKRKNQAVIYDKEGSYVLTYQHFLSIIGSVIELHVTVNDPSSELPAHLINHGVLSPQEMIKLLQESRLFIGLGFPYEGPEPLEALANGCAFIQPKFSEPHDRYNTPFLHGKPTERGYTSQNPYLEKHIGEPYVYTVDVNNDDNVRNAVKKSLQYTNFSSFVPYEFTQEGMLERIGTYIRHHNFCDNGNLALKRKAWSSHSKNIANGPIDGQDTPSTCYRAKVTNEALWWMVDLGMELSIDHVEITFAFDWFDIEKDGTLSVPFQVSLFGTDGRQITSHIFKDVRLFYHWGNVAQNGRYIRVDVLEKEKGSPKRLVICSVGVYSDKATPTLWPDPFLLEVKKSIEGQTCRDACMDKQLVCEPQFFPLLNKEDVLKQHFPCPIIHFIEHNYLSYTPAFLTSDDSKLSLLKGDCVLNGNKELIGCAGHHENFLRLCPCRKYIKGQIALPPL